MKNIVEKKKKKDEILELVVVDINKEKKTASRYKKNEQHIAIQKKTIDDLIATIDKTPRIPSNALVLDSYAKTLTTLKNKIDKQRKALKDFLNKDGEEVHKFYNTTFIKPLKAKIEKLKQEASALSTPIEVNVVGKDDDRAVYQLPTHILTIKCETTALTKVLSYLTKEGIEYEVN